MALSSTVPHRGVFNLQYQRPPAPCQRTPAVCKPQAAQLLRPKQPRNAHDASTPQLPSEFSKRYILGRHLGSGAFGLVLLGIDRSTGQEAAVKVITNDRPKALEKLRNEVASLHRVKECGAVVRCQATFQDPENLYLVMELCHGSDLDNVFKTQGRLSELGTARVAYECLKVLATCHANHIIHGDVKPANFMLARSYSDPKAAIEGPPLQGAWLKAVDLGGSQVVSGDKRLTRRSGTPVYMAPEVFTREYGMEADLWSLGIMSYQLMTGRFPFWESIAACPETMEDVMAAVITQKVPFDVDELKRISPMGVDFLQQLLQTDPAQRISAAYALEHPWFREQFGCDSTPAEASNIVPIPPRCSLLTQQPRSRQRPTVQ